MLIRTMHALQAEGRTISIAHDSASAVRMLTKSDGLGFSFSEAWGSAGISSGDLVQAPLGGQLRMLRKWPVGRP